MVVATKSNAKGKPAEDAAPDAKGSQEPEAKSAAVAARAPRWFESKWTVVVLAALLVVNTAGFAYYKLKSGKTPTSPPPSEVSLGSFHFEADKGERGGVASAKFSLYICLVEETDVAARQRLDKRKYHLQQDIEELLRKAHGGDFEDPRLKELKRQLTEQIDETLGMRAVADVIITDLSLVKSDKGRRPNDE